MKKLLYLLFLLPFFTEGQVIKIPYTVDGNGVHITGVDGTNPVIYDNDMVNDSPEMFYLWLKANRKEINLVGNIATKDGHPQGQTLDATFKTWSDNYNTFKGMGGQNVPAPIKGSSRILSNGQTTWENSAGSDLIISEAKKASPGKPLVLFVGGQVTSIANAFLKDRTIGPNIIVFHVDGWGATHYNAIDGWACQVLIDGGVKYINWDGDLNSWYDQAGSPQYRGSINPPVNRMPGITFTNINNTFHNVYKGNFSHMYDAYGTIGDAPPVFWFFNNSLWQNVARKNKQNQTITDNNFAFLLVSKNNWTAYGPQLSGYMNNAQNYIPATTPPVNQPPITSITNASTTHQQGIVNLTAFASDPDGTVSKVEFFVNGNKIGEDTTVPYEMQWNAVVGTYAVTCRATDNLGAVGSSANVTFTITSSDPIPPIYSNTWFDIRTYGANGSDNINDEKAIQDAYNAAAAVKGTVYWPRASNKWFVGNSITIYGSFIQVNTYAEGEPGNISWRGGSNKNVFNIIGLNTSNWDGLNIEIPSAYSNVAVFNVDTNASIGSSSFNTFTNMYCNVNAPNCVVFRMGATPGVHGDISNWRIKNCVAYGPVGNPQPGTFLVQSLHGNVLANTLEDVFVAYCDGVFSNWPLKNSSGVNITDRGGCFGTFKAIDTSQNICEFYFDREGAYPVYGGRIETPGMLFKTASGSHNISVTFSGLRIDAAKGAGVMGEINTPGVYKLDNCTMHRQTNETWTDLLTLNGQGGVGSIIIDGGITRTTNPNLVRKVGGATRWKVYTRGLLKWKPPHPVQTEDWYPDQVIQIN